MALKEKTQGKYLSIIDGTLRREVPKGTEGAIERTYERQDKTKGIKYELVYSSLVGIIKDINIRDTEFGKQIIVKIQDDDYYTLQISVKSKYGTDFLKRLPNLDLSQEVEIKPFDFEDDKTKKQYKGVTLIQGEVKHKNFFYNTETKTQDLYNFPLPEGDTNDYDSDDWSVYYVQVTKFLINYFNENIKVKFDNQELAEGLEQKPTEEKVEYPVDEINPDDIPF